MGFILIAIILLLFVALLYVEYQQMQSDWEYVQIKHKLEMCQKAQDICNRDCEHCAWGVD